MKKNILSILLIMMSATLLSQPAPIIVTILSSQPATGITQIQYEFSGTYLSYDILVEVSFNGDPYQAIPEYDLSGDLNNVIPGIRNIVWNGSASFPNFYDEQTRIRITATPEFTCGDQITDIDGNIYNTVLIGTQCWMKENLKVSTDADGNAITRYCYDNDPLNCEAYGGLYTWTTAINGSESSNSIPSGVQGICPDGWHMPSDAEWTALTDYTSSQSEFWCDGNSSYIGKALASTTNWQSSDIECTIGNDPVSNNGTGFSGLPGGFRADDGSFGDLNSGGGWWTSTEFNQTGSWDRRINYLYPEVYPYPYYKGLGFSVRCVLD